MIPHERLLDLLVSPETATEAEREYLLGVGVKHELEYKETVETEINPKEFSHVA
jgi:hypothetical protein